MPKKMLILPGIAIAGGMYNSNGLLDRDSAIAYARLKGYVPVVMNVSGETGPFSRQVKKALAILSTEPDCTALYGFSGGGYNVRHILGALLPSVRARLELVVVIGAPKLTAANIRDLGKFELVYRKDPKTGHMDGPHALLMEQTIPVVPHIPEDQQRPAAQPPAAAGGGLMSRLAAGLARLARR